MLIKYFVCSTIFLLFGFIVFRVVVRNDYLNKLKLSPFSYSLEALVFAIHANLMYLFIPAKWPNLPSLPENQFLLLFSIVIFFLGLVILIIAWFGLGSGTSFGLDKNKLKSSGIYQYSRNPQLVGYGIILLGFALLYISWYSLGWFVQYLIISYFMIQSEEEFLSLRYGEEYEKYCNAVPRIFKLI
jgi:protein-S-isoprenylcysteine O-methyltransferase Ste14